MNTNVPTIPSLSPADPSLGHIAPLPASSIVSVQITPGSPSAADLHHDNIHDQESESIFERESKGNYSEELSSSEIRRAFAALELRLREQQEEFEEYKSAHSAPLVNNSNIRIKLPSQLQQPHNPAPIVKPSPLAGQMKARIAPPAIFTGKPRVIGSTDPSVEEWLEYIERYMNVTSVGLSDRCDFAMFYLGGAALSLMQGEKFLNESLDVKELGLGQWDWFKKKLKTQYQPFNKSQVVRDQLNKLRQGNDSVNGYLQAFIQLSAQIGSYSTVNSDGLTNNERLAYFRRGLNPATALEIDKADGIMTYERATGLAAKIESAINTMANSKSPAYSNNLGKTFAGNKSKFSSSAQSSGYGSAGNQNNNGHGGPTFQPVTKLNELSAYAVDREQEIESPDESEGLSLNAMFKKMSQEERTKLMKEGRCFFCKEVGHMTKNCPKKSKIYPKSGNQGKGEARQQ